MIQKRPFRSRKEDKILDAGMFNYALDNSVMDKQIRSHIYGYSNKTSKILKGSIQFFALQSDLNSERIYILLKRQFKYNARKGIEIKKRKKKHFS